MCACSRPTPLIGVAAASELAVVLLSGLDSFAVVAVPPADGSQSSGLPPFTLSKIDERDQVMEPLGAIGGNGYAAALLGVVSAQ